MQEIQEVSRKARNDVNTAKWIEESDKDPAGLIPAEVERWLGCYLGLRPF